MSQLPTLGYWNIRGWGECIRFLLWHLDIKFEDKMYRQSFEDGKFDGEEWFKEKYKLGLPFPNLPYFIDGPNKITFSLQILKYIC